MTLRVHYPCYLLALYNCVRLFSHSSCFFNNHSIDSLKNTSAMPNCSNIVSLEKIYTSAGVVQSSQNVIISRLAGAKIIFDYVFNYEIKKLKVKIRKRNIIENQELSYSFVSLAKFKFNRHTFLYTYKELKYLIRNCSIQMYNDIFFCN